MFTIVACLPPSAILGLIFGLVAGVHLRKGAVPTFQPITYAASRTLLSWAFLCSFSWINVMMLIVPGCSSTRGFDPLPEVTTCGGETLASVPRRISQSLGPAAWSLRHSSLLRFDTKNNPCLLVPAAAYVISWVLPYFPVSSCSQINSQPRIPASSTPKFQHATPISPWTS